MFNSPVFAAAVHALLQPQILLFARHGGYALFNNVTSYAKQEMFEFPRVTEALEQGLGSGNHCQVVHRDPLQNHLRRFRVRHLAARPPRERSGPRAQQARPRRSVQGRLRCAAQADRHGQHKAEELLLAPPTLVESVEAMIANAAPGDACKASATKLPSRFTDAVQLRVSRQHN